MLFEAEVLIVESEGAHTAKEIAAALNKRGFKNPSGGLWTEQNVYSTRRRNRLIDIRDTSVNEATEPTFSLLLGTDGKVTPEDIDRLRLKMHEQLVPPAKIEKMVAALDAKAPSEKHIHSVEKFMNRPMKKGLMMVEDSSEAL